ncbi:hypothetical protein JCM10599A_02990 [Paraburkholderia kururiensis]
MRRTPRYRHPPPATPIPASDPEHPAPDTPTAIPGIPSLPAPGTTLIDRPNAAAFGAPTLNPLAVGITPAGTPASAATCPIPSGSPETPMRIPARGDGVGAVNAAADVAAE